MSGMCSLLVFRHKTASPAVRLSIVGICVIVRPLHSLFILIGEIYLSFIGHPFLFFLFQQTFVFVSRLRVLSASTRFGVRLIREERERVTRWGDNIVIWCSLQGSQTHTHPHARKTRRRTERSRENQAASLCPNRNRSFLLFSPQGLFSWWFTIPHRSIPETSPFTYLPRPNHSRVLFCLSRWKSNMISSLLTSLMPC